MLKQIQNKNLIWNYIQKPTKKDWDFIEKNLELPEDTMMEMTESTQQPRVEEYTTSTGQKNLYLSINVPLFNRLKQSSEAGDLHIIVNHEGITTIIFKQNLPLKSIFHHTNKSGNFKNELMTGTSGIFLINLLAELTSLSFDKIKHINENIDWVKETMFEDINNNNVKEISKIKLDILMFQRTLKPQRNILNAMIQEQYTLLNHEQITILLHQLVRTNIKVWNSIESAQEIIESLEVTNNSIVSFKLNNTMRFLAAVSLITFAMSVTIGIFSLIPNGFFGAEHELIKFILSLSTLFIIIILSIWLFHRKRWF